MTFNERVQQVYATFREGHIALAIFVSMSREYFSGQSSLVGEVVARFEQALNGESVQPGTTDEPFIEIEFSRSEAVALNEFLQYRRALLFSYPEMLMRMAYIYLVALFDAFLADLFVTVLVHKPETLKSKKQLTYEKIVELDAAGGLIPYLAHREINEVSFKSIADQAEYFRSRFNIDLEASGVLLSELAELRAVRNLLVHSNGTVNQTFLETLGTTVYREGEQIAITPELWHQRLQQLVTVAGFLKDSIVRKFQLQ